MSIDEILSIIGSRIREKRNELGITQEGLGNSVQKNKSDISNLENAKSPNPTLGNLTSIANALGMEVWELLKPNEVSSHHVLKSKSLQEFISKLDEKKIDVKPEELRLLENLRIKGESPGATEVYLLFWILHRALTRDEMDKLFE
ncbi:MAG TPA: helix-turn-helix domain-containing protein [Desulfosporosinus sp.]|nr:helix-turn-helix domain-containing protein [Desulfosporosinus sp.]